MAESQSQDSGSPAPTPSAVATVDALRFRPNIVVSGADAHDEDNWQSISICSQSFGVRTLNLPPPKPLGTQAKIESLFGNLTSYYFNF